MLLLNCSRFVAIFTLFYSINFYLTYSASNPIFFRPELTADSCNDTVTINDCDPLTGNLKFKLSKKFRNQVVADYESSCVYNSLTFDWHIKGDGQSFEFLKNKYKNVLVILPYGLKTGKYEVSVSISGGSSQVKSKCNFEIIPESPIPIIMGGTQKAVPSKKNLTIIGSYSLNLDVPPTERSKMNFRWHCICNRKSISCQSCNRVTEQGPRIFFPASDVVDGDVYNITLYLKALYETDWQSTNQIIFVKDQAAEFNILCEKNCRPINFDSKKHEATYFRVTCTDNCKSDKFKWNIDKGRYKNDLQFGRFGQKFFVPPNTFSAGLSYKIDVTYENWDYKSGGATTQLEITKEPYIYDCHAIPFRGKAITTVFKASCKFTATETPLFEIYSIADSNTQGVLLDQRHSIEDVRFRLPSHVKVIAKIILPDKNYDVAKVKVYASTALSSIDSLSNIKTIANDFYQQIDNCIKKDQWNQAIQLMNSLSEELSRLKPDEEGMAQFNKKIKLRMLNEIKKRFPIFTKDQIKQSNALVTRILWQNKEESDPDVVVLGTELCKKAAELQLDYIKQELFPKSIGSETADLINEIAICSDANMALNPSKLKKKIPKKSSITTPYPLITIDADNKDFYDDDEDEYEPIPENIEKFENASGNYIDICYTNANSLIRTLAIGERVTYIHSENFEITAARERSIDIPYLTIASNGIWLTLSEDLYTMKAAIDILFCTTKHNPFSWNFEKISGSVGFLKIYIEKVKQYVTKFKKPIHLAFNLADMSRKRRLHRGSTTLRRKLIDRDIGSHRFEVTAGENFFIEFHELGSKDVLYYLITMEYKPFLDEFMDNQTITAVNNILHYVNQNEEDLPFFISVFPSDVMRRKLKTKSHIITYRINVYTMTCRTWSIDEGTWKFSSNALKESRENRMYCDFYNLSVIAPVVSYNNVTLESTLGFDFEMVLLVDWKIFICIAIFFALFCLLLIYIAYVSRFKVKTAYFLCDTPHHCRYGYLIIVKTGGLRFSGTTSNVCIKVYGDASTSLPHVLNYPDPERRFLQKNNEDWFVLASSNYLGKIQKIELWFDSIGRKPSWYCNEITICDLQTKKHYYFVIDEWVHLESEVNVCITATPKTKQEIWYANATMSYIQRFYRIWTNPHPWNLMESFAHDNLTYFKRLTIMLSILLTIYTIEIFLYSIPHLVLRDGFVVINAYDIHGFVIWRSVASIFVTCVIHSMLVWVFRNSETQFEHLNENQNPKTFNFRATRTCWIILTLIIVFDMTILIGFGFWIPTVTVWMLLTSAISAVVVYVVIIESFSKCFRTFKSKTKTKLKYAFTVFTAVLQNIEEQRCLLYKTFGRNLLRPHLQHLYRLLDLEDIRRKRIRQQIFLELLELFQDILMFFFYILSLYLIILLNRDPLEYKSHEQARNLMSGIETRSLHYSSIESFDDIYDYNEHTLVWAMQSFQWYDRYVLIDPGMMIDQHNKYLGIARFRQQRGIDIDCDLPKQLKFINVTCVSTEPLQEQDFGESWNRTVGDYSDVEHDGLNNSWLYTSAEESAAYSVGGEFYDYSGGGYIALLERSLHKSLANLEYYNTHHWFDKYTRVIFIEFLMYNANCNLFNSIRVIIEKSATGYIHNTLDVQTTKLLFINDQKQLLTFVIVVLFIGIVILFAMRVMRRLITKRKLFFKDLWQFIDLIIILLSFACLLIYFLRMRAVGRFLNQLENKRRNEFVNYFNLLYQDKVLTTVSAILVCIATIRLWKLLRFALFFKIMEKSVLLTLVPILHLMFYQFIIVLAYALVGFMIFGDFAEDFKNIHATFVTLTILSLNLYPDFDLNTLSYRHFALGYVYYISFMLITLLIYTLYIAIIILSYMSAQLIYSSQEPRYNVLDYIRDEFHYFIAWLRVKLRIKMTKLPPNSMAKTKLQLEIERIKEQLKPNPSEIYVKHVTPKSDEHRYANDVRATTYKLEAMKCITLCRIYRKYGKIPEDLMLTTIYYYSLQNKGTEEMFFKNSAAGGKTELINNRRLEEMAQIVEYILSINEPRKTVKTKEIINQTNQKFNDVNDMLESVLHIFNSLTVNVKRKK